MIAQETYKDPTLLTLTTAIKENFKGEYPSINAYMRYKDSFYITDGVILYNDRVVIPAVLRKPILDTLHAAHQGVSAMQLRAQSITFWPGMSYDIERIRQNCRDCNRNAPSQAQLPSEPATPPTTPFEQVFSDFFDFGGHHYLIVGDRLSGWPEIFSTPTGSSHAGARGLIACMRKFFETFGVPEQLSSDGGPEFTAGATSEFLEKWGVKHRISSAYNPQSNGRAEVAVKSAKRLLRSNISPTGSLNSDKLLRALLQLRNTPDPDCNLSPAQIIYGRPIRDAFAFANRLEKFSNPHIHPIWREAWEMKESALRTRFTRTSENLNEHSRQLPPLKTGDKCFIQNQHGNGPKKWDRTGIVMNNLDHNQHVVKVDGSGRLTTRNRRYLRKLTPATTNIEFASPITTPATTISKQTTEAHLESPETNINVPQMHLQVPHDHPHHSLTPNIPPISNQTPEENPDIPHNINLNPIPNLTNDTPQRECHIPLALRRLNSHNNPGLNEGIRETRNGGRDRTQNRNLRGEMV